MQSAIHMSKGPFLQYILLNIKWLHWNNIWQAATLPGDSSKKKRSTLSYHSKYSNPRNTTYPD